METKDLKERWVNPQPIILNPEFKHHASSNLQCPHCTQDYGYLHYSQGQMIIWPDFDNYDSPSGSRGEFILLPMVCELCGCGFALEISNHKGNLLLSMLSEAPRWAKLRKDALERSGGVIEW